MTSKTMTKRNTFFVLAALALLPARGVAQAAPGCGDGGEWTLRRCIDYAVEHNIGVKQSENRRRQQDIQLSTDRNSRLPGVDASVGQNFSFGRGLTEDNTYTNTNTASTSFSIGASVPLFTGMRIANSIKLSRLNLEAATADLEKAKDDVMVQVAEAYVQALYDMEIADVARRQVAIDSMQAVRLEAMAGQGKAAPADLSQQLAALAQSRLTATQAEGNRRLSMLALSQLLELPSPEGFAIVRPDSLAVPPEGGLPSPDAVYAEALGLKPEVKAERLRLEGAALGVKVAQSAYYPQLSLTAGLGTNYYKTSGFKAASFSDQLRNNFSQYVGLSLNVPLFNRLQTRNSVRSARLERENQLLALDNVKKQLYKEIQTACLNAVAARAKYASSRAALRSSGDAFSLAKAKYEAGKADITEFNEARNNYMKARGDLAQARYEWLYQTALVDFYRGKPISL